MASSVIRDILDASGISFDQAMRRFHKARGWEITTPSVNWFKDYIYDPRVTENTMLFSRVSQDYWDVIFGEFRISNAAQSQILAMKNYILSRQNKANAKGKSLKKSELEALYEEAYEKRVELAEKEAQKTSRTRAKSMERKLKEAGDVFNKIVGFVDDD